MLTEFQEAGTGQTIGSGSPPTPLRFFGEQGVDLIVTYAVRYDLAHELFPEARIDSLVHGGTVYSPSVPR